MRGTESEPGQPGSTLGFSSVVEDDNNDGQPGRRRAGSASGTVVVGCRVGLGGVLVVVQRGKPRAWRGGSCLAGTSVPVIAARH